MEFTKKSGGCLLKLKILILRCILHKMSVLPNVGMILNIGMIYHMVP